MQASTSTSLALVVLLAPALSGSLIDTVVPQDPLGSTIEADGMGPSHCVDRAVKPCATPVIAEASTSKVVLVPFPGPGYEAPMSHGHDNGSDIVIDASFGANATLATPIGTIEVQLEADIIANLTDPVGSSEEGGGWSPTVPCTDSPGCPDLTLDPSKTGFAIRTSDESFTATDCNVIEGTTEPGNRHLLRFSTTTPNLGPGDLVLGIPSNNPDWFEWATCHQHWHLKEYAEYRLWPVDTYLEWRDARRSHQNSTAAQVLADHPGLAEDLVAGHKQGFCVIDVRSYSPVGFPGRFHYCGYQGISYGWADEYGAQLDGQWIDVTDVDPGHYVLELEVNPNRFFEEEDYSNNSMGFLALVQEAV